MAETVPEWYRKRYGTGHVPKTVPVCLLYLSYLCPTCVEVLCIIDWLRYVRNCAGLYGSTESYLHSHISKPVETHKKLTVTQEGFRPQKNTLRQITRLLTALEDAHLTKSHIHILYIDFENAFGSVDHARLQEIMISFGMPDDIREVFNSHYFLRPTYASLTQISPLLRLFYACQNRCCDF